MKHPIDVVRAVAAVCMLALASAPVFAETSAPQVAAGDVQGNDVGKTVYDASFHTLGDWNNMQSLDKWKGKFLVLNFWATWCQSCHYEVPELNRLYGRFKDRDTVVVGIAVDNADKVGKYVEHYGVDYPILIGGDEALELSREVGNKIGGLPYTVVITPDGHIAKTFLGTTEKGALARGLTPILDKSG